MFRFSILFAVWMLAVMPARAEVPQDIQELVQALAIPEIIQVMRQEGLDFGDELAEDMFPGRGGDKWHALLDSIYDADRMREITVVGFAEALEGADTEDLTAFFLSPLGQLIIGLEISARRALLDEEVDEANKAHVVELIKAGDPRIDLIREFIEVNGLLENNVVGALNSNFAFITGLVEGGAFPEVRTERQMLNDVWEQEDAIRVDTAEWLYAFLTMAYSPLSDAELIAYTDLSRTPEGQALNTALFAGFDEMFEGISHALGLAAAQMMVGEDL
jgi:hypothetical protein